nr:15589_t:CDS:2 [Entrophospora candida]
MSNRWQNYDDRGRFCLFPIPNFSIFKQNRDLGIYVSGGLFALGWWFFIDSVVYSSNIEGAPSINFEDWMCGISTTLGMMVVNSLDKNSLAGDYSSYSGYSSVDTRDRLFLFVGFALMAGGLAGSVTILILKYILAIANSEFLYFGIALVIQNFAIMLSAVILWISHNSGPDYPDSYGF